MNKWLSIQLDHTLYNQSICWITNLNMKNWLARWSCVLVSRFLFQPQRKRGKKLLGVKDAAHFEIDVNAIASTRIWPTATNVALNGRRLSNCLKFLSRFRIFFEPHVGTHFPASIAPYLKFLPFLTFPVHTTLESVQI